VVGAPGFEPGTSWSQTMRAARLRYAPRGGVYRTGTYRALGTTDRGGIRA
jgi:hypothetical protein